MDYTQLNNEFKRLQNLLLSQSGDEITMIKFDNLLTQFECEHLQTYGAVAHYLKQSRCRTVYDIGCAYGYQSEAFLQENINYYGIEGYFTGHGFWNQDHFRYIEKEYPFKISAPEKSAAVSSLCIGWPCYRYREDIWEEQAKALARDFNRVLLFTTPDFEEILKKYFNHTKYLEFNQTTWVEFTR